MACGTNDNDAPDVTLRPNCAKTGKDTPVAMTDDVTRRPQVSQPSEESRSCPSTPAGS